MCTFESQSNALRGWRFRGTTHDPQNGSTQRSNFRPRTNPRISATSFVLIPWHLIGGTNGGALIRCPLHFLLHHLPNHRHRTRRSLLHARGAYQLLSPYKPGSSLGSCKASRFRALVPCPRLDKTSNSRHRLPRLIFQKVQFLQSVDRFL